MQEMPEIWVWFLSWEDPLEESMATYSSILAWRTPWSEELDGLLSMGHKELDMTEVTEHIKVGTICTCFYINMYIWKKPHHVPWIILCWTFWQSKRANGGWISVWRFQVDFDIKKGFRSIYVFKRVWYHSCYLLKSLSSKKMMRSASQSSCNLGSKASEEWRVLKHVMFAFKVFNNQNHFANMFSILSVSLDALF